MRLRIDAQTVRDYWQSNYAYCAGHDIEPSDAINISVHVFLFVPRCFGPRCGSGCPTTGMWKLSTPDDWWLIGSRLVSETTFY
jgi:hypothetical protein